MDLGPLSGEPSLIAGLDEAPLGVALTDRGGRFLRVNRVFCDIVARSEDELGRFVYGDLVHPEDRLRDADDVEDLLAGEKTAFTAEKRLVRPGGEVRWVQLRASPMAGAAPGTADPAVVVRRFVDVTDRRRTEAERDRFFSLSPDLIAVVDMEGRHLRINPAYTHCLGWTEVDVLGQRYTDFTHPDEREHIVRTTKAVIAGEDLVDFEMRARHRDGTYRWLLTSARPVPEEGIVYVWSRDVTERKKAEESLAQREAQLAEAQRLARIGSWEWDSETGRVACSEELQRIVGFEPRAGGRIDEELLQRVHPDDRDHVERTTRSALRDGMPLSWEARIIRPDGTERFVRVRGRLDRSPSGTGARMVGTIQDTTEFREAEAALRESEERFRRVFEDGPMAIAMIDTDLRIQRTNAAFRRMLGYDEESLQGRLIGEITHPDDRELDVRLAERNFAGEVPGYEIDKRYVGRDGEVIWGRLAATVVRDAAGRPLYGLRMVEDITETKEAEAVRREFDSLKDTFVRIVSHDLQNPLIAIAGLAETLAGAPDDLAGEDNRRLLGRIAVHAGRLRRMVASLLDLDRLYHGGLTARRRPTALAELVGTIVDELDVGRHPLSVEVEPMVASLDSDQVEHIVANLLGNAVSHTPPETPVAVRVTADREAVSIVVEDAGPGVPDDRKETIFQLFRTGDGEGRRTGIGLWVVARFAELHGGRAWVEDRPGGGASFRVVLPTEAVDAAG